MMLSQQAPITNFFFVDRIPFSETLSRNRADEAVELRRRAQRVSRARARFQVLQDLRSRKSLWHPLGRHEGRPWRAWRPQSTSRVLYWIRFVRSRIWASPQ